MKALVNVLQLKNNPENKYHMFSSLHLLEVCELKVEIERYESVYESEMEIGTDDEMFFLESLFIKFQGMKPESYTGHSLSVSDIVKLNDTYWFCDSYGFVKMDF